MVFIEPCEIEELGSCCVCTFVAQGEDDGSDGDGSDGGGYDGSCGVPWGGKCEVNEDCAGSFCCRNITVPHNAMTPCGADGDDPSECMRCWDCGGISQEGCESCGSGGFDCETCLVDEYPCEGGCMHGYGCDPLSCGGENYPPVGWHSPNDECGVYGEDHICGPHPHETGPCMCMPYDFYLAHEQFCDDIPSWLPEYMECVPNQENLQDMTLGACCMWEWHHSYDLVYVGCEVKPMWYCRSHSSMVRIYWGTNTTCEEFEGCCAEPECEVDSDCPNGKCCEDEVCVDCEPECEVDLDCEVDYCCSDFGNCVTCESCDCECIDSVTERECCQETEGNGFWHFGETCESYDCESDCPEEPECEPSNPCPDCFECVDETCIPECAEDSNCQPGTCCEDGCCIECEPECESDSQCPGDQCCKNESCTYDCEPEPECEVDSDCPNGKCCEDEECVDCECEVDSDCPNGKCCEDEECVDCEPEPEDDGACCMGGNVCISANSTTCSQFGGIHMGEGTQCESVTCEFPEDENCDCIPGGGDDCGWYCGAHDGVSCVLWCCTPAGHCYNA